MDDRAGEVGGVEELGRERAGEERLEAEVAATLGIDQPVVAELVRLTLIHGAFEIRSAVSAADALALLGQWQPHLVLLDMDLEGVGGARVLERIGPGGPGRQPIPALALTQRGDLATEMAAFERGVDDIVTLPFSPEELLARVRALAASRSAPVHATGYLETTMTAFLDAALAAQNAVVAAESLGLGTVYLGGVRDDPEALAAELKLPRGTAPVVGLVVGRPDPACPGRVKPRLPQAVVLHHETYDMARQLRSLPQGRPSRARRRMPSVRLGEP